MARPEAHDTVASPQFIHVVILTLADKMAPWYLPHKPDDLSINRSPFRFHSGKREQLSSDLHMCTNAHMYAWHGYTHIPHTHKKYIKNK